MWYVRFRKGRQVMYGVLQGDHIRAVKGGPFSGSLRILEESYMTTDVRLLAPCMPTKVIGIGLNYREHAAEAHREAPKTPLLFLKPSTAVIGPEEDIIYPPGLQLLELEAELGVVIGRKAQHISADRALEYVLGYTCVNDVSARDYQRSDGQWTRGKGFDTFAPVGPCIAAGLDPSHLNLVCRVNGNVRQCANTSELLFTVPELVAFISGVMTLLPGDLIATGTPAGDKRLNPGDVVEIEIEGIGTLRNHVSAP